MGSNEADVPVQRGRGRRPADEVRRGVIDAAGELLFREGLPAVTFERVAAAAGSSKTTLYKWWPSSGALAAEAYFDRVKVALDFPDTGDIEADLRSQLRSFVRLMSDGGAASVITQLIGAAQTDAELRRALTAAYAHPRRDLAVDALRRAQERGQLRKGLDLSIVVDQLWGACYHRLLLLDEPLTLRLADRLVENAMIGARA